MATASIRSFFAEHFPIPYTKKYWMTEAKDLETRWMGSREGSRLYQPSVEEVIQGCNTTETPVTYYSKEMRYPQKVDLSSFCLLWQKTRIFVITNRSYR